MATGVVTWSQTAATNATADSSVNWAEGQAPSSVNDSARALMSSVAKWRDDANGTITTGGTSTAYTVTSNQSFAALAAGLVVAFVPHATNGATVTLNVDALGAKPLRSAPGSSYELGAGVLVQGTPYVATYYTSNSGEWILHGYYSNPYNIPLGAVIPYVGTTAPNSNFVLAYGQAISRTTYASLFSLTSTTFGSGDGTTTFNIPDLRGRVIAGKDDMGGSSANRLTNQSGGLNGDTLGATGGSETHTLSSSEMPSHSHTATNSLTATIPYRQGATNTGNDTSAASGNGTGSSGTIAATFGGSIGISNTGSGGAHNNVQPTIILTQIMRIL